MICSLLARNVESHAVFIYDNYLSEVPHIAARAFNFLKDSLQFLGRFLWNKIAEWRGVATSRPIAIPQNAPPELILLINGLNHWKIAGKSSERRHDACLQILKCREQILQGQINSLDLSNHNLKDLPPIFSLSPFEQITHLHLGGNRLSRLPNGIERLTHLHVLDLSCNRLSALPNIGVLTELTELNVHYNYFASLPEEISSLQELIKLDASYNLLDNLPESLYFLPHLTTLNLSHNRVERLPDELGFLENLTDLHLNDNRLNKLPDTLENLKSLSFLDIQSNSFRAIPEIVASLPEACTVILNGQRPRGQRTGPTIRYLPYEDGEGEAFQQNLSAKISWLFSTATKRRKPLPHINAVGSKQKKSLSDWLDRLPAVLPSNRSQAKQLANRIVSHLKRAERNLPFQEFFFGHLNEATEHCDDRAAFPILKIDIGYQLAGIDKKDIDRVVQFLLKTVWAIDLLEECAQKKCKEDLYADQIEVFLAYPIKLKDELELEIPLKNMKYFTSSHVTSWDLRSAKAFVISQRRDSEAQHLFLKDQEAWQQALRIAYPLEYEQMELDNEKDAELYPLDVDSRLEIEKNAQIQTEQKDRRLIALSKRAFREKCKRII